MSKRVVKPKFRSFPRARNESSDESDDEELNELFKQATLFKNNEIKLKSKKVENEIEVSNEVEVSSEVDDFTNYKNTECLHSETVNEHNFLYCKQCGLFRADKRE